MTDLDLRPAKPGDCTALAALADETLSPAEMPGKMIAPFFGDGANRTRGAETTPNSRGGPVRKSRRRKNRP